MSSDASVVHTIYITPPARYDASASSSAISILASPPAVMEGVPQLPGPPIALTNLETTTTAAADTTVTTTATAATAAARPPGDDKAAETSDEASTVATVTDLKADLLYTCRQLSLVRQQLAGQREESETLRRRCGELEQVRRADRAELEDVKDRLQRCQVRLEEKRRDAADSQLAVVSLRAERDELNLKVQEAWDRVASLTTAMKAAEEERKRLEQSSTDASHAKKLTEQQQQYVREKLQHVQSHLQAVEQGRDAEHHASARLHVAIGDSVRRLACLLTDVNEEYERSLANEAEGGSGKERGSFLVATTAEPCGGSGETSEVLLYDTRRLSIPQQSTEEQRVLAEQRLIDAEAILGNLGVGDPLSSSTNVRQQHWSAQDEGQHGCNAESVPTPSALSAPARRSLHSSSIDGTLHAAYAPPSTDTVGGWREMHPSDEAALRGILTPLVFALKGVAVVLRRLRVERRQAMQEAAQSRSLYQEVQRRAGAASDSSAAQQHAEDALRSREAASRTRAEEAEKALQHLRHDYMERCRALASLLCCASDWAVVEHSVSLLQVRYRELEKDLRQVSEQRLRREADDDSTDADKSRGATRQVSHTGPQHDATNQETPSSVVASDYRQLREQYDAMKKWVEAVRSSSSSSFDTAQWAEALLVVVRVFVGFMREVKALTTQRRRLLLWEQQQRQQQGLPRRWQHPLMRWRAAVVAILAAHRLLHLCSRMTPAVGLSDLPRVPSSSLPLGMPLYCVNGVLQPDKADTSATVTLLSLDALQKALPPLPRCDKDATTFVERLLSGLRHCTVSRRPQGSSSSLISRLQSGWEYCRRRELTQRYGGTSTSASRGVSFLPESLPSASAAREPMDDAPATLLSTPPPPPPLPHRPTAATAAPSPLRVPYPIPYPSREISPPLSAAEELLLHSMQQQRSTSLTGSTDGISALTSRRCDDVDVSQLFAAEVLKVIVALDSRVSNALDRHHQL